MDAFSSLISGFKYFARETLLNPIFLIGILLILLLEKRFPVNSNQKTFDEGFRQEMAWVFLALTFQGSFVVAYTKLLANFYDLHLGHLSLHLEQKLPEWQRFVIGVLVGDFLAWFQHWLKHKVPWFWQFHAVHHSQRQLNALTDYRFHYMEYLISRPIVYLPLIFLGVESAKIAAWGMLTAWHTRFYHANIRLDLGILKYLIVTPQSHRVHHSIEKRHVDQNFAVIFSFWDRIFRTQYKRYDEYPETGIHDKNFPLSNPLKQLVYPFITIGRSLRGRS